MPVTKEATMKLAVLQENLSKGLATVGPAVSTRGTLPITANVLLSAEKSRLKLCATNLEMCITTWIGAKVEKEGAITLPARLFTEFTGSLPKEAIEMELQDHTLAMKCKRFDTRISGIEAEDFPPVPEVTDGLVAVMKASDLRMAISQVDFAASNDESRAVLTGIQCVFEDNAVTLVGADGFRLAIHKTPLASIKDKGSIIIPHRTLSELSRLLSDAEDNIEIRANKGQVVFKLKNTELTSTLVSGTFPNYPQLVPKSHTTRAEVGVAELTRSVKQATLFARGSSERIVLQIAENKITVTAKSEEVGDNLSQVDAVVTGEPCKIGFNGKYLLDVLGAITGKVAIETTTGSSPAVFLPIGQENYTHIIMPMFIGGG